MIGFFALGYGDKYLKYLDKGNKGNNIVLFDKPKIVEGIINKDSDDDGLKDWEESLWKTDLNNSDTDGDGTPDGEEVREGRDPLKAGPDDKFIPKENIGTTFTDEGIVYGGSTSSVNLTQLFAKSLGFKVGSEINPTDLQNQDLLSRVDSSTEQILKDFIASFNPILPESEFNVSSDNSKMAIEKYNDDTTKVFEDFPPYTKREEGIIIDALDTKDFYIIDQYIEYYNVVVNKIKVITVPSNFLLTHKRITELMLGTIEFYKSIKVIDKDPMKTIIGIEKYQIIKDELYTTIIEANNLIKTSLEN